MGNLSGMSVRIVAHWSTMVNGLIMNSSNFSTDMDIRDVVMDKLALIAPKLESLAALLKWQKQEAYGISELHGLGIILEELAHEIYGIEKILDKSTCD